MSESARHTLRLAAIALVLVGLCLVLWAQQCTFDECDARSPFSTAGGVGIALGIIAFLWQFDEGRKARRAAEREGSSHGE